MIYVLVLAIFFEGATHTFEFGKQGRAIEFPTKAACEERLQAEKLTLPMILPPGAEIRTFNCVQRAVKGGV